MYDIVEIIFFVILLEAALLIPIFMFMFLKSMNREDERRK